MNQTEKKAPKKNINNQNCSYFELVNRYYLLRYNRSDAIIKQENWRQKQIETLYTKGRPIFGSFQHYH